MINGKSDAFPRKWQGPGTSQGETRLPADRTPLPTPVWLSVCRQYAGTYRDIGVFVEDDLEEVRREDGWGFEALLRPVYIHLLAVRTRW